MGEIKSLRLALGQRVISIEPTSKGTTAILTVQVSSGIVAAHLNADERRQLIEALGGTA